MKVNLLIISIVICWSCTGSDKNTDSIITIPVAASINESPKQILLEVDSQDVSLIPLANDDKAYLSYVSIRGIDDKHLVLTSDNKVFFYDVNNGNLISMFDRKGKGPQEYGWLSSSVVDFDRELITIYDMLARNLVQYAFNGDFIRKIENDTVIWLASNDASFFAFNNPKKNTQCQFGIYDKDWNIKKSTLAKEPTSGDANVLRIVGMYNRGNTIYVTINDTLSIFTPEFELEHFLTFDKGVLKCPAEVENDRLQYDIMKTYITSDYATLIGDYVYYSYMYNESNYEDLWDLKKGELIGRNIIEGTVNRQTLAFTPKEGQTKGISIKYDDKIISVGDPVYTKGDRTYFVLEQTYVNDIGLFDHELDNPVIMSVVFR